MAELQFLHGLAHRMWPSIQESLFLCVAMATLATILLVQYFSEAGDTKAPTVKFYGRLVPNIFSRLRFNSSAPTVIYAGYEKYRDTPYKLLKPDGDLLVIPNKYCEELRALPDTKLNALEATFKVGGTEETIKRDDDSQEANKGLYGELEPCRKLYKHLGRKPPPYRYYSTTPNPRAGYVKRSSCLCKSAAGQMLTVICTARVVPRIIDELRYAFEVDFPRCEGEWVPIKPYDVVLRLVARAGSRVFVGEPVCRNEAWLDASISFTANIFETVALLRMFPGFMHPFVSKVLPSTRRLKRQLKYVKGELLVPIIEDRRAVERSGALDYQKPDDFLQWMMDLADNVTDAEAGNLAHRLLGILSMAVVHTSAMAVVHALFDLITMPEYLEPLRAEIQDMLPHGWKEATQSGLTGMTRMDSFLRESQRFNPPGHLSFHRIVKEPMTLSDGLQLAEGTHICMPSGPISMDNDVVPNAEAFDGFRWYREKKTTAAFVNTSATNLHFGLGKYACPGRFFAVYMIKAILSRILLDYEFKFDDTQHQRPKNILIGDKVVPDVYKAVFFRRRAV